MISIVVREFARLTTSPVENTLDRAHVPESAFDWLCKESSRLRKAGASLVEVDDRRWLRLDNYIGVIETPCGTRIEILPKILDGYDEAESARQLLRKMLTRCFNLKPRQTNPSHLQSVSAPLTEWVMGQFLAELDRLVKRGVRFDYRTVRDEQRFLRGRLDIARQQRQPPGRQQLFQIEHQQFDADRAENRLLRTALDRVCQNTKDAGNWRLSHELATILAEISRSRDIAGDFRSWRDDRLMAHYQPVRPWCSLILSEQMPWSILGEWRGMSLLFPMERLFERYVEACLRRLLPATARLKPTASSEFLCQHNGEDWFQLKPDFLLEHQGTSWVLDTKWKRLDQSHQDSERKYGLAQEDFYQMFAYGHRYLQGNGTIVLLYPMTTTFSGPLKAFTFDDKLSLLVVPFDLERECPVGQWWSLARSKVT